MEGQGLRNIDGPGARQDGADHRRAESGAEQAVGDAAAIGGLGGELLIQMHRIEVIRRLGEQANPVLGDVDGLLCGHADVEFVEDVTARRMLCDVFDHGRPLSQVRRNGEPHHASSSAA
ncbi:hypothetical protein D3C75_1018400 [compost metagenome]